MGSIGSFEKLKQSSEFSSIYKKGKKWHSDGVVVFFKKGLEKKVGFTASKKVGNAVKRARAKRRMRALFLEINSDLVDGIYVFVAKDRMSQMSYVELKKGFLWSLKRMGCLNS
ncbi:ribonuclease P protein component [Sulfurospirillum sp. 1307]